MLIEQLTHKGGSASCCRQNEDVGSLVGIIGGQREGGGRWGVGEVLITATVQALKCQILEAAVDSLACGFYADRAQQVWQLGGEGADGRVLDSQGG